MLSAEMKRHRTKQVMELPPIKRQFDEAVKAIRKYTYAAHRASGVSEAVDALQFLRMLISCKTPPFDHLSGVVELVTELVQKELSTATPKKR
jgi:hypothetical protein